MSTIYNRRRGAKANRPRTPRQCIERVLRSYDPTGEGFEVFERCPRLAPVNRYCPDHQTVPCTATSNS